MGIGFAEGVSSAQRSPKHHSASHSRPPGLRSPWRRHGKIAPPPPSAPAHPLQADCVFPTRTARFGVALTFDGPINLKLQKHAKDLNPIDKDCPCPTCSDGVSRALLNHIITLETAGAHG